MINGFMFLFVAVWVLIVVAIVIGGVIHMVMFGKIFGMAVKQIEEGVKHQQQVASAAAPAECAYCHATIPANTAECPGCGAKR